MSVSGDYKDDLYRCLNIIYYPFISYYCWETFLTLRIFSLLSPNDDSAAIVGDEGSIVGDEGSPKTEFKPALQQTLK